MSRPSKPYVYKPSLDHAKRASPKQRLHDRIYLVRELLHEIRYGSSLTQLYSRLLVQSLLSAEPSMREQYPKLAAKFRREEAEQ